VVVEAGSHFSDSISHSTIASNNRRLTRLTVVTIVAPLAPSHDQATPTPLLTVLGLPPLLWWTWMTPSALT
jgi:hypothetical protein